LEKKESHRRTSQKIIGEERTRQKNHKRNAAKTLEKEELAVISQKLQPKIGVLERKEPCLCALHLHKTTLHTGRLAHWLTLKIHF